MEKGRKTVSVNREYKSRIFAMIFSDKKELLELYNAISGKHYTDPDLLEVNTLENAIYMSMKNDVSFLVDARVSLYEHQSTYNPNLPLRSLLYLSDLYSNMVRGKNIYGTKKIQIPPPTFIVFYNGEQEQPESQVLRLSDAYTVKEEAPALEVKVLMLNINVGYNEALMNSCSTLRDYAEYTSRIRRYAREMVIEQAVERAITECISEGILKEFLLRNRAEAKHMNIYEYDEKEHIRLERAEAKEEGREEGILLGESKLSRFAHLMELLLKDGRTDIATLVATDEREREKYYEEYHI